MSKVICDYCGTEYADHMQRCPLCGSLNENISYGAPAEAEEEEVVLAQPRRAQQPQRRQPEPQPQTPRRRTPPSYVPPEDEEDDEDDEDETPRRRGRREARREDTIPRWISVLICLILGLAVLIGAVFALYSLGILSPKKETVEPDSSQTLPFDPDQTDDPETDTPKVDTPATGDTDTPGVTPPAVVPEEPVVTPPEEVICIGITLDRTDVTLKGKGENFVLTAKLSPSDCTEKVVWSSEKPEFSKVDQNGRVTAVNGGTTNIVATCGSITAKCVVRNDFPFDASLGENVDAAESDTPQTGGSASLSLTDFTLFKVGETAKITVKNAPAGASVTWTSSDPSVATVDGGTVKAVKSGNTTITATVGSQKLTCIARCKIEGGVDANDQNAENTGSVSLSHEDVTLGKGESFKLSVSGGSANSWSVSDGAICSVDASGNVKGLASGTATISTTVGGKTLKCIVRVK